MTDRTRRARKAPESVSTEAFVAEMRTARSDALIRSRETQHRIRELNRVLVDGGIDYDALNRVMFGRGGWPREVSDELE